MKQERDILIYPSHDFEVGNHNVVSQDLKSGKSVGLLDGASPKTQLDVGGHYDFRSIDQLMNQEAKGYVLTTDADRLFAQVLYRGILANRSLTAVERLQDIPTKKGEVGLYIPYVNFYPPEFPNTATWKRYGLPTEVAQRAQNKADFHNWLVKEGFAEHTPNHIVSNVESIPNLGQNMIRQIDQMYSQAAMQSEYPLGLMIRAARSDGNYGAAKVVQLVEGETIIENHEGLDIVRRFKAGDILMYPDGKKRGIKKFSEWPRALEAASKHIEGAMDMNVDSRVVMSRLLDLEASPGISAVIIKGIAHTFRWNGQWQEDGESACTGTMSYDLAHDGKIEADYFEQSQEVYVRVLSKMLVGQENLEDIYAKNNMDLMIPGRLERKLWQRAQRDPSLFKYLGTVGRNNLEYMPRIYSSQDVLIAEDNPRDTNWTLAVQAVLQALQRQFTLENMLAIANGLDGQIIARDVWPLPEALRGEDMDKVRDTLLEFHERVKRRGDGFILRMPDLPKAGAIAYTTDVSRTPYGLFDEAYGALNSNNLGL